MAGCQRERTGHGQTDLSQTRSAEETADWTRGELVTMVTLVDILDGLILRVVDILGILATF